MADNVNITAGAGTVVATDQVGTDHYQKIKLADGTADSSTMIVAGGGVEAAALRVTIASDSTGLVSVDDNAASLTVDNADITSCKTALELLDNSVDGNYLNVNMNVAGTDIAANAGILNAQTVRVTIATDDEVNNSLASIDGKITACNTGAVVVTSGDITADTELTTADLDTGAGTDTRAVVGLVGTASGGGQLIPGSSTDGLLVNLGTNNDITVTSGTITAVTAITNALPAGTNAIGKLAANTGVDIGDVDILSIAAGNNNIGDVDVASIAAGDNNIGNVDIVTVPAPLSVVGTGTEAAAMRVTIATDSTGVLSVDDNGGALTVDGTVAVTNAGITSIDGKITACNTGAVVLAAGTALAGKVGIDQVTANANEVVVKSGTVTAVTAITNAVAVTNAGITSIDGKVTACNTGAIVVSSGTITAVTAITNAVAVTNAPLTSIDGKMVSGTDIGDVTINNAAGAAAVNIQDGGNAITVDGTVTASNAAGDIAHDSADSGNPVKVGGKAVNMDGTVPGTAVAENDRANFITDLYGRQCVETVHPNFWSAAANYGAAQTNQEIVAAPGASLSLYITDVICSNGAAAGNMKFVEDTAAAADKIEVLYFAINGGAALHFRTPIKLTANKNFGITSVTCTTHSVTINGYTAP
jgi:hypothetical protein